MAVGKRLQGWAVAAAAMCVLLLHWGPAPCLARPTTECSTYAVQSEKLLQSQAGALFAALSNTISFGECVELGWGRVTNSEREQNGGCTCAKRRRLVTVTVVMVVQWLYMSQFLELCAQEAHTNDMGSRAVECRDCTGWDRSHRVRQRLRSSGTHVWNHVHMLEAILTRNMISNAAFSFACLGLSLIEHRVNISQPRSRTSSACVFPKRKNRRRRHWHVCRYSR